MFWNPVQSDNIIKNMFWTPLQSLTRSSALEHVQHRFSHWQHRLLEQAAKWPQALDSDLQLPTYRVVEEWKVLVGLKPLKLVVVVVVLKVVEVAGLYAMVGVGSLEVGVGSLEVMEPVGMVRLSAMVRVGSLDVVEPVGMVRLNAMVQVVLKEVVGKQVVVKAVVR